MKKTELAKEIENDGQIMRAIINYLNETYHTLNPKFEMMDGSVLKDRIEFMQNVIDSANMQIHWEKEEIEID